MKLTEKRIYEIVSETVGEDAADVIKFIGAQKDGSEFKIATDLKMEIQEVRNILYRLHQHNLVTYNRKKDNKKGWYISYWTFDRAKVKELFTRANREKLEKFKERLESESSNMNGFFMCSRACTRMDFNDAISANFRCPECGSLMQQQDNTKTINFLKEKIREIESVAEA